jgi:hypothetical protein
LRALCGLRWFVPVCGSQPRTGQREKVIEDRRRKVEREELSLPRSELKYFNITENESA